MARFILGRLFSSVIVLWIIVTISFFLMRFAPGSPFDEEKATTPDNVASQWIKYDMGIEVVTPEAGTVIDSAPLTEGVEYEEGTYLATVEATGPVRFGFFTVRDVAPRQYKFEFPVDAELIYLGAKKGATLDTAGRVAVMPKTAWQQYSDSIGNYVQLEFGDSYDGDRSVKENILAALPVSAELGFYALIFALFFGIGSGLLAGLKQNTPIDYTVMSGAMVGMSVPTMVSGPLFIAIFALSLGWLPPSGWNPIEGSEWSAWHYRVLPALTLGLVYTAYFARITRGGMLEVIRADYIRTARAKGVKESKVVLRHAIKGAILPTVTYLGPAIAGIVSGSVVVEMVFGIPGLSKYFVEPAIARDYPMVLGVVVVYSSLLILMNMLVDIAYTFLDPRVTLD
ncbi:MAG: oligopeptide transport system permease protein [Myxococcota bacterium]|jgi:oligopeptide transport system permease protein